MNIKLNNISSLDLFRGIAGYGVAICHFYYYLYNLNNFLLNYEFIFIFYLIFLFLFNSLFYYVLEKNIIENRPVYKDNNTSTKLIL